MIRYFVVSTLILTCKAELKCEWRNDLNAKLRWIPPSDSDGDLMVEPCKKSINCRHTAFLRAESLPRGTELTFHYIIKGDHRNFLQLETDRVLWKASGDWNNPQTDWQEGSVFVSHDVDKLFFSGYVVSSSADIRLKGIGIANVSPRCENYQRATTAKSIQIPTAPKSTRSTSSSAQENDIDVDDPQKEEEEEEEEEEEKLEIQKIEVVPELIYGFIRV
ncbi:uncharacterized protein LOC111625481 [Centruroides sculpturatus]|uniref:uncharacterized protein LOC111625481 n=1 Tax=Centruroides sculpturatus TaxID=218467 RepID=UPI000C6CE644|nr:uncharacterized protein LOC111625481 [Centruroides sculpturatus]